MWEILKIVWSTIRHGESVRLGFPRGHRPLSREPGDHEQAAIPFTPEPGNEILNMAATQALYASPDGEAALEVWLRPDLSIPCVDIMYGNRRIGTASLASAAIWRLGDLAANRIFADGTLSLWKPPGPAKLEVKRLSVVLPA
jgi:hypothetical protein